MKSFLDTVRSNIIAQAVLSIVLGAFLALMPQTTTLTVVYLLALYLAVSGIASLVAYFRSKGERYKSTGVLVSAVFLLVVALLVFLFPQVVAGFFSFILGFLLAIGGVVNVVRAIELRGFGSMWIPMLVVGVLVAIGGVVIIVNPFETTVTFVLVLGILLIVKGIADLVMEASFSRMTKEMR